MRAVIQRVREAAVSVQGEKIASIGKGLLVLLAVSKSDTEREAEQIAAKIVHLRVFEDEAGALNRSLIETGGALLVVSQFTLLGDCRKGRRPSFVLAADSDSARRLYEHFVEEVGRLGVQVRTGRFRAHMEVSLVNDGPVTLLVDCGDK